MFNLGSDKEAVDDGTALQVREASDLLRLLHAQEQLLERAMSGRDMSIYEIRAQQISELLEQMINGQDERKWLG
jgi:hypothetical protein